MLGVIRKDHETPQTWEPKNKNKILGGKSTFGQPTGKTTKSMDVAEFMSKGPGGALMVGPVQVEFS
jgi:hypothetical protein